jgi:hypothetical protein
LISFFTRKKMFVQIFGACANNGVSYQSLKQSYKSRHFLLNHIYSNIKLAFYEILISFIYTSMCCSMSSTVFYLVLCSVRLCGPAWPVYVLTIILWTFFFVVDLCTRISYHKAWCHVIQILFTELLSCLFHHDNVVEVIFLLFI